jgi:predicted unusual protein kinase regulating ubiquinone biosynthesis (AarF/ABC1/UbiB family)
MFKSRYRSILMFFASLIFNFVWWELILARIGFRGLARRTRSDRTKKLAASFRIKAVQMGGVMIKVGQFLSARLDVLPREVTDELSGLQDEVQPVSFDQIRTVVEGEFGVPLEEKFCSFDPQPTAAASIGQVHHGCIREGNESLQVVVKVQRPQIEEIVETDLAALRVVSRWLMYYKPIAKRVSVPRLMEEFSTSLFEEVDYINEGQNADAFTANFSDDPDVRVPKVYWNYTTRRVLVLEDVEAIKINDYAAIEAAGIDRVEVSNRLADTYLKQIFEDRFFHADPHPGNLFVEPVGEKVEGQKRPWRLVFIDFGMTGRLAPSTFTGLRDILIAVGTQDAPRMIQSYKTLGILLPGADLELLERASARVFERFWGKSTNEMMGMHQEEAMQFVDEFGELLRDMPFQVPENMILLGRCVSILSGMCTGLNPDFNVWTSIVPYAEKLISEEGGSTFQTILNEVGNFAKLLIGLPKKTETLLNKIEQGKLVVRTPRVEDHLGRMERGQRRLTSAVVFAAFLLSGSQLFAAGHLAVAAGMGAGALLALVWLIFTR